MSTTFADSLKSLRIAKGLSQQQLAIKLFVDRSTVARWELGERLPDLAIIPRVAECLGVDAITLLSAVQANEPPRIIVVDDERTALLGAIAILEKALPHAAITGFNRPSDAIDYTRAHPIAIAFLDIEMSHTSGLDLCQKILEIRLKIGELSGVLPECIQEYFNIASRGTIAEGARLCVEKIPITIHCGSCGYDGEIPKRKIHCPECGSSEIKLKSGREYYVDSLEVE